MAMYLRRELVRAERALNIAQERETLAARRQGGRIVGADGGG
ncbi:hypothetical protein ACIGBH_40400 [Streptomyces sp. NPDC085929]